MNRNQIEANFSVDRLSKYFAKYPANEPKALYLYEANLLLSEALYTPLSILEVALRNKINEQLKRKYKRDDWYADWYKDPIMHFAWYEINSAISHLHKDKKAIMPDKVIAGLMFGFWTSLFNDKFEKELWHDLRFVFPNMPKKIRQRTNVSKPLNDIRRTLRNRIYHNEPISFNLTALETHHKNILQLLEWMGTDLLTYNNTKDRFTATLLQVNTQLNAL